VTHKIRAHSKSGHPEKNRQSLEEKPADGGSMPSCCRHTNRSEETKKALLTRLKKAEGQIRGIEKMVENDLYCPDILIQVSAVTSALNSFNKVLLQEHIKGCVTRDIKAGKDETVDELCRVLQKLMK
jgi:CsoR family transcriptional regulator, copper-sensing transcriptional repressor